MKRFHIFTIIAMLLCLMTVSANKVGTSKTTSINHTAQKSDTPPVGTTAYYELTIRNCFKKNDWAGAKRLLDEGLEKYPQMSALNELMGKYYIHMAETDAKQGKSATPHYDKARYYLIRAISIDEKNVQARYDMLKVETETGHYSTAIVYCNDLLEENPYNEELWRKKIDLYRRLNNNDEADRLLERIYSIYPGDAQLRRDVIERKTILAQKQRENGDFKGQEQTLRQLIELDPNTADHHHALINFLYSNGRVEEAAEAAAHGASVTKNIEFIKKHTSMLCELNRHREAVEYVRNLMVTLKYPSLKTLLNQLELDAAHAAQYNDAYIAYAKIYESQHSAEVLDYLVATSIERWYLDDALYYIGEHLRVKGESPKMLYNQYLINKRLGNTRKANALLEDLYKRYPQNEDITEEMMLLLMDRAKEMMDQQQYYEAIPVLEKIVQSDAYAYLRDGATRRLFNCYFQTKLYAKAENLLSTMSGTQRITQTALLYNAWGKPKKALDYLAESYRNSPSTGLEQVQNEDTRRILSYTYEEIALPFIKELLNTNRVYMAEHYTKEAIEICPESDAMLRYGITASGRAGDTLSVKRYIELGRQQFPEEPYYILKDAQQHIHSKDYDFALDEIMPLFDEFSGDSAQIAIFVECNVLKAEQYLKKKQPDAALEVIRGALEYAPDHTELFYLQGQAYEMKKEWQLAYESYKKYKPGLGELVEYNHHLEEVSAHTIKNTLSIEYQQARPGSDDVISGNAYLNYSHTFKGKTTLDVGMAYAGRDGSAVKVDKEMTTGGTAVQIGAGVEHSFTSRFTAKIEAAWAPRYFPIINARLSASYDFNHDWQLSAFASYRLLNSYAGVYGWVRPVLGYNSYSEPILGDPEYVRTGWSVNKKSMFQVGAGVSKGLNHFTLSLGGSVLLFNSNIHFNSNLKMQYFPKTGNRSDIFTVIGVGTAPESSLIDRSMPVGFNKLNTFVSLGGDWFINRWLSLTLSGSWYTILAQSERLATTYIVNDPLIMEDYRNYFYIHGGLKISF